MKSAVAATLSLVVLMTTPVANAAGFSAENQVESGQADAKQKSAEVSDKNEVGDPNRVICRRVAVTGSRLQKTRLCHTARQWDDMQRDNREQVERAQQQRTGGSAG